MRKKRVLLICLIGAALAVIAVLVSNSHYGEPPYGGHPLNYWVLRLGTEPVGPQGQEEMEQAQKAIDHIGVAALPFLVKWVQYDPPRWRVKLAASVTRSRFPFIRKLSDPIMNRRAARLANGTVGAFAVLRTRAMPALGELCHLMYQTNTPITSHFALFGLIQLGTNALPALLTVAANTESPVRLDAISAIPMLPNIRAAAEIAVPVLTNCLSETNNPRVQAKAAYALGDLTAVPQISIPALQATLAAGDPQCLKAATYALNAFATSDDPSTRQQARAALAGVLTNAPVQ
jgi:hypothetical protein